MWVINMLYTKSILWIFMSLDGINILMLALI